MRSEIILNDEYEEPALILSSCDEADEINLRLFNSQDYVRVKIEDLKLAIRKLTAK